MGSLHTRLERLRVPVLAGYAIVLYLATMTPFYVDAEPAHVLARLHRALLPGLRPADVVDAARNIVLFSGWGLVWMATAPGRRTSRSIGLATLSGALISLAVEACQLFSRNRFASVLDVMTNTAGSFAGAALLAVLVHTLGNHRERKSYFGLPAALLAGAYGAGAFLEAVIPLFQADAAGRIHGPLAQRMAFALATFTWRSIRDLRLEDMLLFLPAGALAVVALAEAGLPHRAAAIRVSLAGAGLTLVAELLHPLVGERISFGLFVAGAGAVALGAWATARWLAPFSQQVRGANRARIFLALYVGVLVLWAWRPYIPELDPGVMMAKLRTDWWVPLAMTERRDDLYAVVNVCVPFFLSVPLGALLAVWPLRRSGLLRTALPGIYLVAALEAGQLFIAWRYPDITDFLVTAAGVVTGWLMVRRAGYQPHGELLLPPPARATP